MANGEWRMANGEWKSDEDRHSPFAIRTLFAAKI